MKVLKLLVLVDDLYAMFVLFLCGFLAYIGEMAIDGHDGRCCRVAGIVRRSEW